MSPEAIRYARDTALAATDSLLLAELDERGPGDRHVFDAIADLTAALNALVEAATARAA